MRCLCDGRRVRAKTAIDWLNDVAAERGVTFGIELTHEEGRWVGAGEPVMYVTGQFAHLVDLETFIAENRSPCVAAWNAFTMCSELPKVGFSPGHVIVPAARWRK